MRIDGSHDLQHLGGVLLLDLGFEDHQRSG